MQCYVSPCISPGGNSGPAARAPIRTTRSSSRLGMSTVTRPVAPIPGASPISAPSTAAGSARCPPGPRLAARAATSPGNVRRACAFRAAARIDQDGKPAGLKKRTACAAVLWLMKQSGDEIWNGVSAGQERRGERQGKDHRNGKLDERCHSFLPGLAAFDTGRTRDGARRFKKTFPHARPGFAIAGEWAMPYIRAPGTRSSAG